MDKDGQVKVTLLDLGSMSAVGDIPNKQNQRTSESEYLLLEKRRKLRVRHLSPELYHGRAVDAASDIHSLGFTVQLMARAMRANSSDLQEIVKSATALNPEDRVLL